MRSLKFDGGDSIISTLSGSFIFDRVLEGVFESEGVIELARAYGSPPSSDWSDSDSATNNENQNSNYMLPPPYNASILSPSMPPIRHKPSKEVIIQEAITGHRSGYYRTPTGAAKAHGIHPDTIIKRIDGTRISRQDAHQFQQKLSPESELAVEKYCTILI
jgi:hypothetical protein